MIECSKPRSGKRGQQGPYWIGWLQTAGKKPEKTPEKACKESPNDRPYRIISPPQPRNPGAGRHRADPGGHGGRRTYQRLMRRGGRLRQVPGHRRIRRGGRGRQRTAQPGGPGERLPPGLQVGRHRRRHRTRARGIGHRHQRVEAELRSPENGPHPADGPERFKRAGAVSAAGGEKSISNFPSRTTRTTCPTSPGWSAT